MEFSETYTECCRALADCNLDEEKFFLSRLAILLLTEIEDKEIALAAIRLAKQDIEEDAKKIDILV